MTGGAERATAQALAATCLAVGLAFSPLLHETFHFPKWAALVLGASVVSARLVVQRRSKMDPLDAAALAWLAVTALSGFVARDGAWIRGESPRHEGVVAAAAWVALFFGARAAANQPRAVFRAAVLAGDLASLYALAQWLKVDPLTWDHVATFSNALRPFGTFGHPNALAAWVAMALPLRLSDLRQGTVAARAGEALRAVISCAALVLTLTRSAWLAAACGVAVTVGLLTTQRWGGIGSNRLRARWLVVPVGMVAIGVLVAPAPIRERLKNPFVAGARGYLWRGGVDAFAARPWLGWGVGNIERAFTISRPATGWETEGWITPDSMHADAFDVAVTRGLVGLAAAATFAALFWRRIRERWRDSPEARLALTPLLGALAAWLVCGLVGFSVLSTATFAAILLGLAAGRSGAAAPASGPRNTSPRHATAPEPGPAPTAARGVSVSRVRLALAAVLVLLGTSFSLRALWASALLGRAWRASSDPEVVRLTTRAAEIDRGLPGSAVHRARLLTRAGQLDAADVAWAEALSARPEPFGFLEQARIRARRPCGTAGGPCDPWPLVLRALELDPRNAMVSVNAVNLALQAPALRGASALLDDALSRTPRFGPLLAQRAYLLIREGKKPEALHQLRAALAADWHFAESHRGDAVKNLAQLEAHRAIDAAP
ncbi:MAG: O-antigen ligase family protein [Archangium sp.]|nr:O-antigen ligase family protein [Archangium sp.]